MEFVKIIWVQDGFAERRESAVTYSKSAAPAYVERKKAEKGVSDVQIVSADPE
ncbi:hypothetical protein SAMN05216251_13616 [Actinacidiphila alni]|uniref:Uncharacterized protein n=1 Tax=Actinacidiphila alni TaxID=380248 RepID=A0A1I2MJ06_9ACTN|nr:hypothetical protein [Actinacidiphila alni]SFF90900.1 hypothetical protein SAMN05216251_13616 [Actinacidiphila alni]